jgi:hypothetical protein
MSPKTLEDPKQKEHKEPLSRVVSKRQSRGQPLKLPSERLPGEKPKNKPPPPPPSSSVYIKR